MAQPPIHPRTDVATRRSAVRRRAGLTLAELTVSLGIIATIMAATGSIMVLTGRAVGMSASHAAEARIDDVIATLAAEQRLALNITEYTPKSITFTVADRTGDGVPETIRYAWSGVQGDPLTRQVNGGTPTIVLQNVRNFCLTYLKQTVPSPAPVNYVESATDSLLYAHETGSTTNYATTGNNWCAGYFYPTFPSSDVNSWRVTQVQVMMSRIIASPASMTGKSFYVKLYAADPATRLPTGLPLEEKTIAMSSLTTSMNWSPVVTFSANSGLDPAKGYCIVIGQPLLTTTFGSAGYDNSSTDGNTLFSQSNLGGAALSWTAPSPSRDLKVRVYGRYTYPAP